MMPFFLGKFLMTHFMRENPFGGPENHAAGRWT